MSAQLLDPLHKPVMYLCTSLCREVRLVFLETCNVCREIITVKMVSLSLTHAHTILHPLIAGGKHFTSQPTVKRFPFSFAALAAVTEQREK